MLQFLYCASIINHIDLCILGLEDFCNSTDEDDLEIMEDLEDLKAVVPEGVICQVDKKRPERVLWQTHFASPIVHAWRLVKGQLVPVNLFSNSHLPKINTGNSADEGGGSQMSTDPSLYIGSYNQQLYIQESDLTRQNSNSRNLKEVNQFPKINWKPYLISADSR